MIESIKKQGGGWLVNNNKSVPNDLRNTDCQEVLAYIEGGGTVEDEFTPQELAQHEQNTINSEALAYLSSTDWYIVRNQEVGAVIPADVLTKRQAAREAII